MTADTAARILLVDDDEELRSVLSKLLRMRGYEVITARDGNDAAAVFRSNCPDLVITDIMMPEKDGLEFIQEIRRLRAGVPIICISGGGNWQLKNQLDVARLLGASLTLEKPILAEELWAAVESLLPPR